MAALTIDDCYKLLRYRGNKSAYLSNISPNDFNLLWPQAELRFFNSKYKQYGLTKKTNDTISKVKSAPIPIAIDSTGKYTFPADMLHESSVTHVYNGIQQEVEEYEDDRLANKLSSSYEAPNMEFPIYIRYDTYLQFYPINLGTAILTYLKQSVESKWGYTLTNGRPVYDPNTSVQPVWSKTDADAIVYLILADFGINARDNEAISFADNELKQQ